MSLFHTLSVPRCEKAAGRRSLFRRAVAPGLLLALVFGCFFIWKSLHQPANFASLSSPSDAKKYIKWVDFDVTAEAMWQALRLDVDSYGKEPHYNWIELLAWLGARYGGDFSRYRESDLEQLTARIQEGTTMEEITKDMKYYSYYLEAYGAVLGGMVGTYEIQLPDETTKEPVWTAKYGLKAFSPIAKGYPYQDFDDFGVSRSYGFKRQHLGHDLMGQVGTPIFIRNYILSIPTRRIYLIGNIGSPIIT